MRQEIKWWDSLPLCYKVQTYAGVNNSLGRLMEDRSVKICWTWYSEPSSHFRESQATYFWMHQPLSHPLLAPGRARSSVRGGCSCRVAEHCKAQFTSAEGYLMTSDGVCTRPCTGATASSQLGAHGGLLAGLAVSRVPRLEGAIGRKCFILSWCCEEIHAASAETGIFNFYMPLLMFFKHFHLEKMLMFGEKSVLDSVSLILE